MKRRPPRLTPEKLDAHIARIIGAPLTEAVREDIAKLLIAGILAMFDDDARRRLGDWMTARYGSSR